ncbi:MAG TPA: hypothetical protein VF121_16225 [Thermoanaerobaculia bacterium]|nr:hypothetical protein [Thermoanaerobaculia bacterium]
MSKPSPTPRAILETLSDFATEFGPLEAPNLLVLTDKKTGALYVECHVSASQLVGGATTDVPLDPDEQPEYRANREIVADDILFERMKNDALYGRTFSNIVAEYTKEFDADRPLKIIGGQHRFEAIRLALEAGVDEHHGIKVYLALSMEQRLDVQVISNTNIAISADLLDRIQETFFGPELRNWCQRAGLLEPDVDFADHRERGGPIPVREARTFIVNYYLGKQINARKFEETDTTPYLSKSGATDDVWEDVKKKHPGLWNDPQLLRAAKEFGALVKAQRQAFVGQSPKPKPDLPEKAMNPAILAAWAYVAGMLHDNDERIQRHFSLRDISGRDPLNAAALAKGRHRTDADNYRGLGYRTDARERGRFVELFFLQAEDGRGITSSAVDLAIKEYHAKVAVLEVIKATERR